MPKIDFTESVSERVNESTTETYRLRIYSIDNDRYLTGQVFYKTLSAPVEQARLANRSESIPQIRMHASMVFDRLYKEAQELNLP